MNKEHRVVPFPGVVDSLSDDEREMLERAGFFSHYVFPNDREAFLVNAHTHGLSEIMGHPDLQIVLPLSIEEVNRIFNVIVKEIKAGRKFKSGDRYDNVYKDCEVMLWEAENEHRRVLRIIVPDARSRWPDDPECMDIYNKQYEDVKI